MHRPLGLLLLLLAVPSLSAAGNHAIKGQILLDQPSDVILELSTSSGQRLRAFSDKSGVFVFNGVPAGTHLVHVLSLGYMFPELRVEVGSTAGLQKVTLSHDTQQVLSSQPFLLRPLAPMSYYELRRPVDIWGFIKSPYGMMISFMVFGLVIFPRLKVDPEEYKEFKEGGKGAGSGAGAAQGQPARVRDR